MQVREADDTLPERVTTHWCEILLLVKADHLIVAVLKSRVTGLVWGKGDMANSQLFEYSLRRKSVICVLVFQLL